MTITTLRLVLDSVEDVPRRQFLDPGASRLLCRRLRDAAAPAGHHRRQVQRGSSAPMSWCVETLLALCFPYLENELQLAIAVDYLADSSG